MRIKNVPGHTVVNRPNNVLAPGQWSTKEEVENCEGCSGNSRTHRAIFFFFWAVGFLTLSKGVSHS